MTDFSNVDTSLGVPHVSDAIPTTQFDVDITYRADIGETPRMEEREEDFWDIAHLALSMVIIMLFVGGPFLFGFLAMTVVIPHYGTVIYWLMRMDIVCFLPLTYIAFEYKGEVFTFSWWWWFQREAPSASRYMVHSANVV